jgi:peptide/nickel transport system permease protein
MESLIPGLNMGDHMSTSKKRRESHLIYSLKRFANFVGIFAKNPRGIIGIAIIAVFAVIAIFPSLFTPYDPVNQRALAGWFAAPAWLRSIPAQLGGMPDLSFDANPILNSGFENSTLQPWNITSTDQFTHATVNSEETFQNHTGLVHIGFSRDEVGKTYGNVTVSFTQEFYYQFTGPPFSFTGTLVFNLNGTITTSSHLDTSMNESNHDQWPWPTYNITVSTLDVPTQITMYLQSLAVNRTLPMWPLRDQYTTYVPSDMYGMAQDGTYVNSSETISLLGSNETTTNASILGTWTNTDHTDEPIDSNGRIIAQYVSAIYGSKQFATTVFFPKEATPGWYRLGLNVTFVDIDAAKPVSADLLLDTLNLRLLGTGWGIMGADHQGRDLWSQLMYGARISLYVGVLSTILAVGIGLIVGLMAGYLGKIVDEILMRISDVLLVLPGLPLLIVLVAVLGTNVNNLIILLGALGWMGFARLVRSQVISLRERPFIEAAKAVGAGKTHIMIRHILPNVMSLVYVTLATTVPGNIVAEASLGFLGFTDPNRMSWGLMLNNLQQNSAFQNWWWVIPPGLCIALIAIAFILFGYALDEVLNPRLRLRR